MKMQGCGGKSRLTIGKDGRETQASVKRRIADFTGFQYGKIILMESNSKHGVTTDVQFQVNGRGFTTDFKDVFEPAHQFDQDVLDEYFSF